VGRRDIIAEHVQHQSQRKSDSLGIAVDVVKKDTIGVIVRLMFQAIKKLMVLFQVCIHVVSAQKRGTIDEHAWKERLASETEKCGHFKQLYIILLVWSCGRPATYSCLTHQVDVGTHILTKDSEISLLYLGSRYKTVVKFHIRPGQYKNDLHEPFFDIE
jgi:hypothetical protein